MREFFVDTNVLIDFAREIEPEATYAKELFLIACKKSFVMNICSLSYNTVYYITKKRQGRAKANTMMQWLSDFTKCLPVDHIVIKHAKISQFRDFEDAIQYYCAFQIPKCEAIITRNVRDFRTSAILVMSPYRFLVNEL